MRAKEKTYVMENAELATVLIIIRMSYHTNTFYGHSWLSIVGGVCFRYCTAGVRPVERVE